MIKDFDFTSVHAVRKQCWTYKSDGNTPIKKGKNLYPLEVILNDDTFKGYFIEVSRENMIIRFISYGMISEIVV